MKRSTLIISCILICITGLNCDKDNGDNDHDGNGGNGGNGSFNITGTSPDYVFWGGELTINGTGFSTNAADYSFKFLNDNSCADNFQTTVLSATSTQLKIKAPIGTYPNSTKKCGPDHTAVVVTMNNKSDTTSLVKMAGWPLLGEVCSHFGVGPAGDYFTPGDSAMLGVQGATGMYANASGAIRNVQLTAGGEALSYHWYAGNASSCSNNNGAIVTLPLDKFAVRKCSTDPDWNGGWRLVTFTARVPGTDRVDTKEYLVKWLPSAIFHSYTGPASVSKSAGGNPYWTIYGNNMYYEKVRYTPLNCQVNPVDVTFSSSGFYNTNELYIPLSQMSAGCSYSVRLLTKCGTGITIGQIQITL